MELTIRKATTEDAPAIAKIHVETWQEWYKDQMPQEYLDALSIEQKTESWKKNLSKPVAESQTFVATENGNDIGYCSVGVCRYEDVAPKTGELYAIYMDVNSMGKGVGSKLMEVGLMYLKELGYKKCVLVVLDTNTKTRKFYEKRGWSLDGKGIVDERDGFTLTELRYEKEL